MTDEEPPICRSCGSKISLIDTIGVRRGICSRCRRLAGSSLKDDTRRQRGDDSVSGSASARHRG